MSYFTLLSRLMTHHYLRVSHSPCKVWFMSSEEVIYFLSHHCGMTLILFSLYTHANPLKKNLYITFLLFFFYLSLTFSSETHNLWLIISGCTSLTSSKISWLNNVLHLKDNIVEGHFLNGWMLCRRLLLKVATKVIIFQFNKHMQWGRFPGIHGKFHALLTQFWL